MSLGDGASRAALSVCGTSSLGSRSCDKGLPAGHSGQAAVKQKVKTQTRQLNEQTSTQMKCFNIQKGLGDAVWQHDAFRAHRRVINQYSAVTEHSFNSELQTMHRLDEGEAQALDRL